jgi:hypothetical protein
VSAFPLLKAKRVIVSLDYGSDIEVGKGSWHNDKFNILLYP